MRERAGARDYLFAGLLTGAPAGVLSALPWYVCTINLCGFTWPFTAGLLAALFVCRFVRRPLAAREGATAGVIAGCVTAVCAVIVLTIAWPVQVANWQAVITSFKEGQPEDLRLLFDLITTRAGLVLIATHLVFASVCSAGLGGLIGAALRAPRTEQSP